MNFLGNYFWNLETPVFIFLYVFITEIYLKNIWQDNWRFSIWCCKRTLLFWNITNLRFVAQLRLQQRKELGLELLSWWPKVENWFIWQLSAFIIQLTRPLIFILKGQLQITCFKIISRGILLAWEGKIVCSITKLAQRDIFVWVSFEHFNLDNC